VKLRSRLALLVALALVACKTSGSDKPNDGKRMPKPPPPAEVAVPNDLKIPVVIDGADAPAIDAARLLATRPDYSEAERRAWRLETLLGPASERPGAQIAVTGEHGITIVLRHQSGEDADVPVLTLNRRGEIFAAMVEADQPFPAYHGQGGRLGRRGDPLPRVAGVTKIIVTVGN
jgi:hypothetical protein